MFKLQRRRGGVLSPPRHDKGGSPRVRARGDSDAQGEGQAPLRSEAAGSRGGQGEAAPSGDVSFFVICAGTAVDASLAHTAE